ncbi:MAG: MmgE/PrpD family protein [Desulfovibrio sp.]|jgi:2-methylcitrate dehydratase PrpD|nr:MmgE/PrpD family protein [Desulfovibrio sp.]
MQELVNLSKFLADFHIESGPPELILAAKLRILDTVGPAIGAGKDSMLRSIADQYYQMESGVDGRAGVWGQKKKTSMRTAAFLNGMFGHILEMDDVHAGSKAHVGSVVVPAAWAAAEYLGSTSMELLEAIVCGFETLGRIGSAIGAAGHRTRGWHVTGTVGTFGAAASVAKLLKLDAEHTLYALGIAGTQASGLWAFLKDGATNKVLHIGRAVTNGIEAAFLSKAGMSGSRYILDAEDGGLFPATSDSYDLSLVDRDLGKTYEILDIDTKPYPSCRSTHPGIDAAFALINRVDLDPNAIESIEVGIYLVGYKQTGASPISKNPQRQLDARFSMPYCVACVLLDREFGLEQMEPEHIVQEKYQKLLQRIHVYPDEKLSAKYPKHWGCAIKVRTFDGKVYEESVSDPSGSAANPMTPERIRAKSFDLARRTIGVEAAEAMAESIMHLEKQNRLPEF